MKIIPFPNTTSQTPSPSERVGVRPNQWIILERKTQTNEFSSLNIYNAKQVEKMMGKEAINIMKRTNMLDDYKLITVVSHKWSLLFCFRHQNKLQKLFNI